MIRSLALIALVTVLSALAACTASTYWAGWDRTQHRADQTVDVLPTSAATHIVAAGETAYSIAHRYGVALPELSRANGLGESFIIHEGDALVIPGRADAAQAAGPVRKPVVMTPKGAPGALIWPVAGPVLSGYGLKDDGRINEGINIAVPAGSPVLAAADGVVTYAGNEIRGYGNLVLIRHDGEFVTAYAHNQRLKVKKGLRVHQGEIIALSGATGTVATPQLHFEVRRNGAAVDPVAILGGVSTVAAR